MKHIQIGVAALVIAAGFLGTAPAFAREMTDPVDPTFSTSCEQRDAELAVKMERKAAVHASLNARHDELSARMDALIASAADKGIDSSHLQAALAVLDQQYEDLNEEYAEVRATWESYLGNACSMSSEEWAAGLDYSNDVYQRFEHTARLIAQYKANVVDPLADALKDEVLSFGR